MELQNSGLYNEIGACKKRTWPFADEASGALILGTDFDSCEATDAAIGAAEYARSDGRQRLGSAGRCGAREEEGVVENKLMWI